jgi:hypothetical protein
MLIYVYKTDKYEEERVRVTKRDEGVGRESKKKEE